MEENNMTVFEHITELRKRLIIVVVFFLLAVIGGFFLSEPLIKFLQGADEAQHITLNAFNLPDPFKIFLEVALIIGVIATLPFALFQLWSFVSPGLLEKERKVTLSYIPLSVILFLLGLSFSYFILFPFVVQFMTNFAERLNIQQVIGISEYFHFLFQLTIPFGILFQLPVVVMFLTRLGIVTPMLLTKVRRYAYFVLLVIAAFITPPEILSHIMVTIPLLLLYEISIWISKISYRKVIQAEQEALNKEEQSIE